MFKRLTQSKPSVYLMGSTTTIQFESKLPFSIATLRKKESKEPKTTEVKESKQAIPIEFPLPIIPPSISPDLKRSYDEKWVQTIRTLKPKHYYSKKEHKLRHTLLRFKEGSVDRICAVLHTIGEGYSGKAQLIKDITRPDYFVTKTKPLNVFNRKQEKYHSEFEFSKKIGVAVTQFKRESKRKEYDLALVSSLDNNLASTKAGIIYLSKDNTYLVRNLNHELKKDSLNRQEFKLYNLKNKLKNPHSKEALLSAVFKATAKAGHTEKENLPCPRREIIQHYIPGKDLTSIKIMGYEKGYRLHWKRWLKIAKGMIHCVKELHSLGIIHCDIKPSHFLLWGGSTVLIDLDLAHHIYTHIKQYNGTPQFVAVETRQDGTITTKSDIYMLGASFAIIFGFFNEYGVKPLQLGKGFSEYHTNCPAVMSDKIYKLIAQMMSPFPEERPSLDVCLKTIEKIEIDHAQDGRDYEEIGIVFMEDILKIQPNSKEREEIIKKLHMHESICLVVKNDSNEHEIIVNELAKENICVLGIFKELNTDRHEMKNAINSYVNTALYRFVKNGEQGKIKNLLQLTGNPNAMGSHVIENKEILEPAIFCALRQNDKATALMLLQHRNFDLNTANQYGSNLLTFLLQLRQDPNRQSIANEFIKMIFANKKLKDQVFGYLNDETNKNQIKQLIEQCLHNKEYFILKEMLSLENPSRKTMEIFMMYRTKIAAMFRNILVPLPYENTLAEVLLAEENQQYFPTLRA